MGKTIYASFCGTGKTYLCGKSPKKYVELECWKYTSGNFPHNYVNDIEAKIEKTDYLFISTNPVVLKQLHKLGIQITLIYPKNNLKNKYMKKFKARGSSGGFIDTLNLHWDAWIDELKEQNYCNHVVLSDGQYLEEYINLTQRSNRYE